MKTAHDLRCFCRRSPLLAVYGVDEYGELYIELKVYKQRQVYGHIIAVLRDAKVLLQCRECTRWHRVLVRVHSPESITAELTEIASPIPEEATDVKIP